MFFVTGISSHSMSQESTKFWRMELYYLTVVSIWYNRIATFSPQLCFLPLHCPEISRCHPVTSYHCQVCLISQSRITLFPGAIIHDSSCRTSDPNVWKSELLPVSAHFQILMLLVHFHHCQTPPPVTISALLPVVIVASAEELNVSICQNFPKCQTLSLYFWNFQWSWMDLQIKPWGALLN